MDQSTIILSPPLRFHDDVTATLLAWRRSGLRGVLVTLVGIDGASPRPLGSQMAVNERGEWVGQISSDCAEAAIAREALASLAAAAPCTVRYGRGSPYLDVRLPCGSGLDVHFDPLVPTEVLAAIEAARQERRPVTLVSPRKDRDGSVHGVVTDSQYDETSLLWITDESSFARHYAPATRLVVAGRGMHAAALIGFGHALGWDVALATPDEALIAQHAPHCRLSRRLARAEDFDPDWIDSWSAIVLLFHEHAWEPAILARALEAGGGFYVGALGSRAAHASRCAALRQIGVADDLIARIRGPVGLDIGAATPTEIALAVAADIVSARRRRGPGTTS